MNDGYRFVLTNPRDSGELARISALLREVFPGADHLTPRYLDWLYARNPDGEAVGCNAYSGETLVGHMAAAPMSGLVEGDRRPGLFMLNGAVHPKHRRRRLQSRISAAIFEESARRGYVFCFGTGNRYSTLPLLTRFRMVRPLEARLGIGVPARRKQAVRPSFERAWSTEALSWRLANPEARYEIRTRNGSVGVMAKTGTAGVLAILMSGANCWGLEERKAASKGPLRLWLGLDPGIAWTRSAFVPIPRALRPSPLNLVYKDLTGGDFLPDPDRVVFRAIDFDPY